MAFELPALPFPRAALEPHVSARTMEFHHGKHHAAYVETLNKLVQGTEFERMRLEEIIQASADNPNLLIVGNLMLNVGTFLAGGGMLSSDSQHRPFVPGVTPDRRKGDQ